MELVYLAPLRFQNRGGLFFMANKHKGEVPIKLDKVRKLRFNTNALAELEDALGYSLGKLDTESIGIKTLLTMFCSRS